MEDRENLLLKFFEENKNACIRLHYLPNKDGVPCNISFETLYEIIKLKIEKDADAVRMD